MRFILAASGLLSLGLGILGIFLPVLPTTPLLLLPAALFLRSSKPLYDWLMNHPKLGPYIKNFMVHKSIPLKVKIISGSRNYSSYPVIQYSLKTLQFLSVTEF